MIKDRNLNIAILFSMAWHLLWMSLIGVVVTPTVEPSDIYQEVDFLGPILEKTAFDLMVESAIPHGETLYARETLFLDGAHLRPPGPKRKIMREFTQERIFDKLASLKELLRDTKEVPTYITENPGLARLKRKTRSAGVSIEGPAMDREVIFKPGPLTVPRGLYGDREEYAVTLKFVVSGNGIVYDLKPVVSSGYPEIDLHAIRFLKRWRFSPESIVEKDKSQVWGITTVKVFAK